MWFTSKNLGSKLNCWVEFELWGGWFAMKWKMHVVSIYTAQNWIASFIFFLISYYGGNLGDQKPGTFSIYGWETSRSMKTSSNGNISRVTGHLCGEFTGPRWIPRTKAMIRSFYVFFDLRLNKRLSKHSWGWWFETLPRPLWRHSNAMREDVTFVTFSLIGW